MDRRAWMKSPPDGDRTNAKQRKSRYRYDPVTLSMISRACNDLRNYICFVSYGVGHRQPIQKRKICSGYAVKSTGSIVVIETFLKYGTETVFSKLVTSANEPTGN